MVAIFVTVTKDLLTLSMELRQVLFVMQDSEALVGGRFALIRRCVIASPHGRK